MKIEDTRANVEPAAPVNTDGTARPSRVASPVSGDAVRLSDDLQLANRAMGAMPTDFDRSSMVEAARELVARGELTVDADRVADRMLDALLHSDDHHT